MTTPAAVEEHRARPRARAAWSWLGTPDGRAVLVLVLVPLVAFVVPALAGYPAIGADNLIQNFPLRALSGQILAAGHLPLWNPLVWSGTPLLGGLNAGALYPGTFLFAVLPAVAAWVANLLAAYWAAGLGLYALLRHLRLAPRAALLAAVTFAFAGAMTGQMDHLPVVQGWAWTPLLMLALLRLGWAVFGVGPVGLVDPEAARRPSAPAATVLLAVTLGLIFLTGEPRGMAQAEIVAAVTTLWVVLRPYGGAVAWGQRAAYLGWVVLGAAWGAALGAVQLLPGLSFITASQRAGLGLSFFGSGSLLPKWSVLLFVPDIFGGDGILHQPAFFASYNLPEVTGYVGLVPLVAAFALATRSFGRRRDPRSADWGLWLALALFGLLLAWGTYTPLGGLFGHIPFFNKARLQSRNLGIVDLGLAGCLGFWLDRLLGGRSEEASLFGWRRWVALVPALMAGLVCLFGLVVPGPLERVLGANAGAHYGRFLTPWFLAQLAVAGAVVALVLLWDRLGAAAGRRLVTAVVVADVALFTLAVSTGLSLGDATAQPSTAAATAVLGAQGRFALYDTTALNLDTLSAIGQPDLNAFTGLPSVQGYSALIAGTYGDVTGSHDLDTLDPCALQRGVFVPLRLRTLLSLPQFIAPQLVAGGQVTGEGAPPAAPEACPGAPAPGTAHQRTWYLGQVLALGGATLTVEGHPGAAAPRVGVITPGGTTAFPAAVVRRATDGWTVRWPGGVRAAGVVVLGAARTFDDHGQVTTTAGTSYSLDGELQDALGRPGWAYTGSWEGYGRFTEVAIKPPVWLARDPAGGQARQVSTTIWGTEVDQVSSPSGAELVRSEAYLAGWRATAVPVGGGPSRSLGVVPVGLVQGVRVPAGRWLVTFTYRPPSLRAGEVLSGLGALALVGAGVAVVVRRRRVAGTRR